ncbi:hypothetical protein [Chitinolyticbacter albus]|uniref:hypothetical protein n=1 Tax=Chitinolyticbacter albus TaxID=2961951 RepID=UPI00210B5933|nr:hypothetical protein [Chitinolyticbacter albus]
MQQLQGDSDSAADRERRGRGALACSVSLGVHSAMVPASCHGLILHKALIIRKYAGVALMPGEDQACSKHVETCLKRAAFAHFMPFA